jgi:hypothetical protein
VVMQGIAAPTVLEPGNTHAITGTAYTVRAVDITSVP